MVLDLCCRFYAHCSAVLRHILHRACIASLLLFSWQSHASFIESTLGTAVVNDATAAYYNPAALMLLKNPQIIAQGSWATFQSSFNGQFTQVPTGFTQVGVSGTQTRYFLPSVYMGIPATDKITVGVAIIANVFNNEIGENALLRYTQSQNSISDFDVVPAIGMRLNRYISVGAGFNISHASFLMQPVSGFPTLHIPDAQSRNQSSGTSLGADAGLLLTLSPKTTFGFNYRSAISYKLSGKSVFEGSPSITSNDYSFNFWTPARSVLSMNHFITSTIGMIATVQRIQWGIFNNVHIKGIATRVGVQPAIVNANVPYDFHDTWLVTLGTHYRATPKWVIRFAGSYNQSAGNTHTQLSNGDSVILGTSMGYEIFKNIIIDGSYAHAFFYDQKISISTNRNIILGQNKGLLNSVSLKLTVNI